MKKRLRNKWKRIVIGLVSISMLLPTVPIHASSVSENQMTKEQSAVSDDGVREEIDEDLDVDETDGYEPGKYGLTRVSYLSMDGVEFVSQKVEEDERIVRTSLSDGRGGTITFDPETMTVIINSYHFREDYEYQQIYCYQMPSITFVLAS